MATYNWHEERGSFTEWFITHCLAKTPREDVDEIGERSDKFHNVVVEVLINGVSVDTSHFLESVERNMNHFADEKAREIVKQSTFADDITQIMSATRSFLLKQLRESGIEIHEDDWGY